ncbi:hypothetical protein C5E06_06235 [Pseudoclavibacter sp. RFBI5]|uniref:hypothetical protein n=1 Tax=Pseudoclavibacter sp. RFBI5 TaxID=2080578 RepID=UPI000CE76494|nr:hypothetical protein [Pseudoclavibacter sp. RFBI5]PPG03952.1 hypothetical protein C5E06_06235 [Pseudoclavibacter sp. RFBI5]
MSDAPLTRRELRELERRREKGEQPELPTMAPTVSVETRAGSDEAAPAAPIVPAAPAPPAESAQLAQLASGVALEAPLQIDGLSPTPIDVTATLEATEASETPDVAEVEEVAEAPELPGDSFNRSPAAVEQEAQEDGTSGDYFRRLVMASHSTDETPTGMIVMPEMSSPDITGALSGAGDLMITGKMQVSRELSNFGTLTTGLDSPEIDHADEGDEQLHSRAVEEHSPVAASRAVREPGMPLAPRRGHGVRLSIWAVVSGLAVAVAGVVAVILGIVQGWF